MFRCPGQARTTAIKVSSNCAFCLTFACLNFPQATNLTTTDDKQAKGGLYHVHQELGIFDRYKARLPWFGDWDEMDTTFGT